MTLKEIVNKCKFEIMNRNADAELAFNLSKVVSGAYSGDLLSDIIANSKKDNLWITMQTHLNIIAVASLKELSAIVIVMNKAISDEVIQKAEEEKIIILRTEKTAYEISGKLFELGVGR